MKPTIRCHWSQFLFGVDWHMGMLYVYFGPIELMW